MLPLEIWVQIAENNSQVFYSLVFVIKGLSEYYIGNPHALAALKNKFLKHINIKFGKYHEEQFSILPCGHLHGLLITTAYGTITAHLTFLDNILQHGIKLFRNPIKIMDRKVIECIYYKESVMYRKNKFFYIEEYHPEEKLRELMDKKIQQEVKNYVISVTKEFQLLNPF